MTEYVLDLGFESPPLRDNDRLHWAVKSKRTKDIRSTTAWRAKAAGIPRLDLCEIVLVWSVTDNRRRDSSAPEPTKKAAIDGLVDAGVIADDHSKIVARSWCEIELAAEKGVALMIRELEEAA